MTPTADDHQEHIPLVNTHEHYQNYNSNNWRHKLYKQFHGSYRVLIHLYVTKLLVKLSIATVEGSLPLFSTDIWLYPEEGGEVLLVSIYDAISPCLPLVGGILADSFTGTAQTTIGGVCLITIAVFLFTLDAFPFNEELPLAALRTLFAIGLSLFFLGGAGFVANIGPLAARHRESHGYPAVRKVFHVLFWFETIAVAVGLVVTDTLESTMNFGIYYGFTSIVMIIACVAIMTGNKYYITITLPKENALVRSICIIYEGVSRRCKGALDVSFPKEIGCFIDYAKTRHGGSFEDKHVEQVKHLLATMPVFHTVTIYSIAYYQIETSFKDQTRRMDLAAGNIVYPNITFQMVSASVILLLVPILLFMYPNLDGSKRFILTPFRKIGIGIVFAGISLISAAIVETQRKNIMDTGGYFLQTVNNITYNASRMNVLYQLPQYTFIGVSEAMIRTSGAEMAFTQAPDHMKGIVMGLYLMMSGLGSFLISITLTWIVNECTAGHEWITDEMNDGYYEYYFYILTGLQVLDLLYLYMIARKYTYSNHTPPNKINEGGIAPMIENSIIDDDVHIGDWEYVTIVNEKPHEDEGDRRHQLGSE